MKHRRLSKVLDQNVGATELLNAPKQTYKDEAENES